MKAILEIHMEEEHSVRTHMIEICMHHHPLLVLCGLSLVGIMTINMQLQEITEGTTPIIAMIQSIMTLIHIEELIDSVTIIMLLIATMNLAVTVILVLIGTKGLEAENVRNSMVSLKTGIAALMKERIAMREIMNMVVTTTIQIMREAGEMVAGEGTIHVTVNVKEED